MIQKLYGRHYDIYPLYCRTDHSGHSGTTRARLYVACVHKKRARVMRDIKKVYMAMAKTMMKHVQTTPDDYMIATMNDIKEEAERVARVRKLPLAFEIIRRPLNSVFQRQVKHMFWMMKAI